MEHLEDPRDRDGEKGTRALLSHGAVVDALARELARCAICERPFSALLISPDRPPHLDAEPSGSDREELGSLILQGIRSIDMVGRYGRSELLVLLPETTGSGALALAERLLAEVIELPSPLAAVDGEAPIGVSVALVECGTNTRSIHGFLNAADRAMKLAKERGSGRVQVAEGSEPELVMRAMLAPSRLPDVEDRRGNRNGGGFGTTAQSSRRRDADAHERPDDGTSAATA